MSAQDWRVQRAEGPLITVRNGWNVVDATGSVVTMSDGTPLNYRTRSQARAEVRHHQQPPAISTLVRARLRTVNIESFVVCSDCAEYPHALVEQVNADGLLVRCSRCGAQRVEEY